MTETGKVKHDCYFKNPDRNGGGGLVVAVIAATFLFGVESVDAQSPDVCPVLYSLEHGSCEGYNAPPAGSEIVCADDDNSMECIAERLAASPHPDGQDTNDDTGIGNADCQLASTCNEPVIYAYQLGDRIPFFECEVFVNPEWRKRSGDGTGDCTSVDDGGTQTEPIRNKTVIHYNTLTSLQRPASYYDEREFDHCDSIPSSYYNLTWLSIFQDRNIVIDAQDVIDACQAQRAQEERQSRVSVDDGGRYSTITPPNDDYTNVDVTPAQTTQPATCPIEWSAANGWTCEGYVPQP